MRAKRYRSRMRIVVAVEPNGCVESAASNLPEGLTRDIAMEMVGHLLARAILLAGLVASDDKEIKKTEDSIHARANELADGWIGELEQELPHA